MAESEEKPKEKSGSTVEKKEKGGKLPTQYYVYAGLFVVAFVLGLLLSNAMSSGKIEDITTQNKEIIDDLQSEKAELRAEKVAAESEVESLERQVSDLQSSLSSTQSEWVERINAAQAEEQDILDILNALVTEGPQVRREVKEYYEIQWPRFIVMAPGEQKTSTVTIENTGINEQDFDLDVRIDAKYQASFDDAPADGSLTLDKGGSGNINLKFEANDEGMAIFGLYVNNHYAGDIVGFVVE